MDFPQPHRGIDISRARFKGSPIATLQPAVNHWLPLHRYAPDHVATWDASRASNWYYNDWLPQIPSYGCPCQAHWDELTQQNPPDFSSPGAFFQWAWARHNDVSTTHSKRPTISLDEAYQLYWSDHAHPLSLNPSLNSLSIIAP